MWESGCYVESLNILSRSDCGDGCIQGFDIVCIWCAMFIRVWWQYIGLQEMARFQPRLRHCPKKGGVLDQHVHNEF
ncbi:hypothetical protein DPMN_160170 [Dreissena polymorpha]|uniref:Uncharacterized protein n=1 Tax=Dreissena polymorpha TaxID=45954 RepID=A0A9D4IRF4_DREPO|nr:hypothetical protein DPMN_160170 [Dreissena polymorpha]